MYEGPILRGIHILTQKMGKSLSDIDLGKLDMKNASNCVLGQLFGYYWTAVPLVYNAIYGSDHDDHFSFMDADMIQYGFNIDLCDDDGECVCDWSGITDSWKKAIREFTAGVPGSQGMPAAVNTEWSIR